VRAVELAGDSAANPGSGASASPASGAANRDLLPPSPASKLAAIAPLLKAPVASLWLR
jgi:hypothetical protein